MKKEKSKEKKQKNGFGLRLSFAIILTVFALTFAAITPIAVSGGLGGKDSPAVIVFPVAASVFALLSALQYVAAFVGKKHKWANVVSIIIGILCINAYFLGLLAIFGGDFGNKALKAAEAPKPEEDAPAEAAESVQAAAVQTAPVEAEKTEEEEAAVAACEQQSENGQTYEKQEIKRSDFKLDLYDANIDEKTWKQFKKTASQEELAVIAIGAKYRVAHSRVMNIIYAIGIILSIALFWPTGGWSLIGYPVFAFLATKSIRYEDTYSQSYRKLNKEFKAFVDGYFNSNIGLTILDTLIKIAIFWITIPYQAILLLIGMFAPNFVISKNGILVSIPKGYDVGGLGAVGAYYQSFSFIDEAMSSSHKAAKSSTEQSPTDKYYHKDEYTYTDSNGYEQTVYSGDGKDFYDAGGNYVGSDGGEFKKK